MFCKYCGTEVDAESVFCSKCGNSLSANQDMNAEKMNVSKSPKMSKGIIILAAVITIIIIMAAVVYIHMIGVKIVSKTVEAGSVVTAKDLIKAKSANAAITLSGEIDTDTLGESIIICNISNGIFKANKKIAVTVVDTTAPKIIGPDSITISSGKAFNPGDYYTVEDFEKNLQNRIEVPPSVDTQIEGKQEVELKVADSSGNEGTFNVTLRVLDLTTNEEKALLAINQYIADGNSKDSVLSSAWIMKTSGGSNGVDYYVEVASNVLYAIYDSGEVSEFTAIDCGGSTIYELLVYAVHYDGTTVNTVRLIN